MSPTFDADLAKANLYRMRADFRRAEEVCIGILKTYPNSAATHTLLGDIYSDQGLLEQAAQWYELSLDLDPSSLSDKHKLDDVREQMKERDHISSVEQLGLPERRGHQALWNVGLAACILLMAVGIGWVIRNGRLASSGAGSVVNTPIKAVAYNESSQPTVPLDAATAKTAAATSTTDTATTTPPAATSGGDPSLQALVAEHSPMGTRLVSVVQDPRTKVATVTYNLGEDDDDRAVGAELARTVLEQSGDPVSVTVRGMRNDKLVYMADVPRSRYADTLTADWQQKSTAPDAWVSYILTNEWPAKTPPSTDPSPPLTTAAGGDSTG